MIKLAHAVYDENKKSKGGNVGDQNGKEIDIWSWYKSGTGWKYVIRPKDIAVAEKIAKTAKAICENDNIGYDQTNRTSLYDLAVKVGFDISKIKTKCECDCSSMVATCVSASGVKVSKDMYTGNELAVLKATNKFEILSDKKYLNSADYLRNGDILLRPNGHTAVAIEVCDKKDLQKCLNAFGYGLVVDGIIGTRSKAAIEDLKTRYKEFEEILNSL